MALFVQVIKGPRSKNVMKACQFQKGSSPGHIQSSILQGSGKNLVQPSILVMLPTILGLMEVPTMNTLDHPSSFYWLAELRAGFKYEKCKTQFYLEPYLCISKAYSTIIQQRSEGKGREKGGCGLISAIPVFLRSPPLTLL